jgi:hypothetical protein
MQISRKTTKHVGYVAVMLLIGAQLIRPNQTNPKIDPAMTFDELGKSIPEVASIVQRVCSNCHSNSTVWPWYSHVAPASWLIASDVRGAREHLNFSEWGLLSPNKSLRMIEAACDEVKAGDMPPWYYRLMHPEAKLTDKDVSTLCNWASKMDSPRTGP